MGKHPTGLCERCQVEESVVHVIMECDKYEQERQRDVRRSEIGWNSYSEYKNINEPSGPTGLTGRI